MSYIRFADGSQIPFPRTALTGISPSKDARNYIAQQHPNLLEKFDKDLAAKRKRLNRLGDIFSQHKNSSNGKQRTTNGNSRGSKHQQITGF